MTTSELISYIKKQINDNISKDEIISKLLNAGWHRDDIEEGFSEVESEAEPMIYSQRSSDKYREPLVEVEPVEEITVIPTEKIEEKVESQPELKQEVKKEEKMEAEPKIEQNIEIPGTKEIEVFNIEISKTVEPKEGIVTPEKPKSETPKIWTPMKIPVKEHTETIIPEIDKKEEISMENQDGLLPTLMPKAVVDSFGQGNKENTFGENTEIRKEEPVIKNSIISELPKMAMLSSYQNDVLSLNKIKEEDIKQLCKHCNYEYTEEESTWATI